MILDVNSYTVRADLEKEVKREIKELRADVAGLGKKVGFLEKLVSDMHWFKLPV